MEMITMGLDAFVRCRCFEEGKITEPPLPLDDLYVSEEGYIESHLLDEKSQQFDWRRFNARYGALQDALYDWQESCCEHPDMKLCTEWVCNISGWSKLRWLFEELGPITPTLSTMLPDGNGGCFPAVQAESALHELDILEERLPELLPERYCILYDCETGITRRSHVIGEPQKGFPLARFANGEFYVWTKLNANPNDLESAPFHSSHFKATLIEGQIDPYSNQRRKGRVLLEDLEGACPATEISWWDFCQMDRLFQTEPVEYRVGESSEKEWAVQKIKILRRLLHASLETGNPIQWC